MTTFLNTPTMVNDPAATDRSPSCAGRGRVNDRRQFLNTNERHYPQFTSAVPLTFQPRRLSTPLPQRTCSSYHLSWLATPFA